MQEILLLEVDCKKTKSLKELCEIWCEIFEKYKDKELPRDIVLYILSFVEPEILKESIMLDNFRYFLIQNRGENIGFIEYEIKENEFLLYEFQVLKKFKTKENYVRIVNFIKDFSKNFSLKIFVNCVFQEDIELLSSILSKEKNTQTRYIGSNYFLKEVVFK